MVYSDNTSASPRGGAVAEALRGLVGFFTGAAAVDEEEMLARARQALLQGELQVPVFPTVARRATDMLGDPDVSMGDLSSLVETDAALAVDLLRLVNSPAFTGGTPISSVRRAIVRLGFDRFRAFLFAVLRQTMFPRSDHTELSARYFRRSLATACVATALRPWVAVGDDPFILGLLHNVGQPCMLNVLERLQQDGELPDRLDEETLAQLIEATYEVAGGTLALEWGLPGDIRQVILFHAHPDPSLEEHSGALLVHFATLLCRRYGLGFEAEPDLEILDRARRWFGPEIGEAVEPAMEEAWMLYGDMAGCFL